MSKFTNPFTWAAELVEHGLSIADALRTVAPGATFTTTELTDATAQVNLEKYEGKQVWNTTTTKPTWASGADATDVWVNADGTTAHTPS